MILTLSVDKIFLRLSQHTMPAYLSVSSVVNLPPTSGIGSLNSQLEDGLPIRPPSKLSKGKMDGLTIHPTPCLSWSTPPLTSPSPKPAKSSPCFHLPARRGSNSGIPLAQVSHQRRFLQNLPTHPAARRPRSLSRFGSGLPG